MPETEAQRAHRIADHYERLSGHCRALKLKPERWDASEKCRAWRALAQRMEAEGL